MPDAAAPIDLVVLALARTGVPIEQTAQKTGLSVAEAGQCLTRATRILGAQRPPALSRAG